MHSTNTAALLRVALKAMASTAAAFAVVLALATTPATAATHGSPQKNPCANRLCTKYKAHTPRCWEHNSRSEISRCFIRRAARHFHQSLSQAYYIAHRESRYDYKATNSSSGAAGLYQFMPRTWAGTPYHSHSPYHPRWAALAAMWMWKHGGYSHWS
jgi:soluble lytic murein transglycosylase-like protein